MVHRLGRCYMLPGVDYLSFSYAGEQFPAFDEYDTVCKWCVRTSQSKADPGSSGTKHFVVFRRVSLPCESSANFQLIWRAQRPRLSEPAQRATVQRTKNEGQRPSWIIFCLKCPGRFGWGTKGFHTEIGFPHVGTSFRFPYIRLELAIFATSRSVVIAFLVIFYFTGILFRTLRSPMRRNWNPPLSTCFATAQFTKASLGRFA